jgi:hypothetical protein
MVERLTGIHRDTIMRLGVRVGNGCDTMYDAVMRGVDVARIELDEAWSFIAKKQGHLPPGDSAEFGDQYVFIALAGAVNAIVSCRAASVQLRTPALFWPISGPVFSVRLKYPQVLFSPIQRLSNWRSASTAIMA